MPSPAAAAAPAVPDMVCTCFDLRREHLAAILQARPGLSFEALQAQTGAGTKCTACLLDLEYLFVEMQQGRIVQPASAGIARQARPGFKRRLYDLVDRIAPAKRLPIVQRVPVLAMPGVEQNIWIVNHPLLYEDERPITAYDAVFRVFDAAGRQVHQERRAIERGTTVQVNVSAPLLKAAPGKPGVLGVGSVELDLRARTPGLRGTTRPQIEIIGPGGASVNHTQTPNVEHRQTFTTLWRPDDDRVYLAFVNYESRPQDIALEWPINDGRLADGTSPRTVRMPPDGAELVALDIAGPERERLRGAPVTAAFESPGRFKCYAVIADRSLTRFSIDHL